MAIPTKDQVVAELSAITGDPDTDYASFVSRIDAETNGSSSNEFGGKFLNGITGRNGVLISGGVVPEVRSILQAVVTSLSASELDEIRAALPDGSEIGGLRKKDALTEKGGKPSFGHAFGHCIDFPAAPYLYGESKETDLDIELKPVYDRVANMFCGRDSVIPLLGRNGMNVADSYDRLSEESAAHIAYFYFVARPVSDLVQYLQDGMGLDAVSATLQAPLMKVQMLQDYLTVTQVTKPVFNDATGQLEAIAPLLPPLKTGELQSRADRPYTGKMDPKEGFLSKLPRGMTIALSNNAMLWGGSQLDAESGDLMHFQLDRRQTFMVNLVSAYRNAQLRL